MTVMKSVLDGSGKISVRESSTHEVVWEGHVRDLTGTYDVDFITFHEDADADVVVFVHSGTRPVAGGT